MSIVIGCINQDEAIEGCWHRLVENTTGSYDLLVIDNGSTDGTPEFLERHVLPRVPAFRYIRNPENVGVWGSLQQGYLETSGDVIAFLHNDLAIYERGWNERVIKYFEQIPDLGVAGFHGSKGCTVGHPWRVDAYSNLTNAESYGARLDVDFKPVAVLDGLALICRRSMLDAVGGFDQGYGCHHWYDYETCVASLHAGFKNIVINVSCYHIGFATSGSHAYRSWVNRKLGTAEGDAEALRRNQSRYLQKWAHFLPVYVNDDFSLSRGGAA